MADVRLKRDRIEIKRSLGRTEERFYEELHSARQIGGGLSLQRHVGEALRLSLGKARARELATVIQQILGGPEQATSVHDVEGLGKAIERWLDLPGFSAVPFVDFLFRCAARLGASDLHWEPVELGYRLSLRLHGHLRVVAAVPKAQGCRVVGRLKHMADVLVHRSDIIQEGRADLDGPGTDIRLSFVPSVRGESVTARLFDRLKGEANFRDLGFDPTLVQSMRRYTQSNGLILFAGSSASGKTTTLYTLLRDLISGSGGALRIVTVEDPVEYRLADIVQLEVCPERGNSYASLLRSVLRQDANVIVVGEIRDPETATLAVRAALTGHLVLSTVHAGTPTEALIRLLELGVPASMLASAVTAVLAQSLMADNATSHGHRCAKGELVEMTPALAQSLQAAPTSADLQEAAQ